MEVTVAWLVATMEFVHVAWMVIIGDRPSGVVAFLTCFGTIERMVMIGRLRRRFI